MIENICRERVQGGLLFMDKWGKSEKVLNHTVKEKFKIVHCRDDPELL